MALKPEFDPFKRSKDRFGAEELNVDLDVTCEGNNLIINVAARTLFLAVQPGRQQDRALEFIHIHTRKSSKRKRAIGQSINQTLISLPLHTYIQTYIQDGPSSI